jgi:hypothetical protein
MVNKFSEIQRNDKSIETQTKDGPCTAIADEEEDEFCKDAIDELKDHFDKFDNKWSALQISHSETFQDMIKRLRTRDYREGRL